MKTKNLIQTVAVTALVLTAAVQARPEGPKPKGHSGFSIGLTTSRHHDSCVITPSISISTPKFSLRTGIFTPMHTMGPWQHRRPVVIHRPAPVITHHPEPVVTHCEPVIYPAPVYSHTVTVWIDNYNGSQTPVVLTREGCWYIGPNGERYSTIPTANQLRPLYGLGHQNHHSSTINVYIPNYDGTQTLVTLTRTAQGFIGPKGELYTEMPSTLQLRMLYGR